jgi:hypothetical protein
MHNPINKLKFEVNNNNNNNTFILKKKFVDIVYNAAKLEVENITFLQTQLIIDNLSSEGLLPNDIQVVLNLKNAMNYCLNTNDFNIDLLLNINKFVSYNESLEWGVLRNGTIGISGTNYKPEIPSKDKIELILFSKIGYYDKMLELITEQPFWDGNKRTCYLYTLLTYFRDNNSIIDIDIIKLQKDLYSLYKYKEK